MRPSSKPGISAIGLDIGRKRIGVAGCDRLGLMASGLTTIYRQSFNQVVAELTVIVQDRQAEVLVVGLPLTVAGEEGAQAKQVRRMATGMAKALNLPVVYVDERFTSLEAEALIRQQGQSIQADKGLVDRKAAALILQRWLDEWPRTEQDGIS
ncbi:MAG: Holliday junction resolvase RuvX [Leptolyngbya sp.]|nr:Holliday junction resolvase RuvX [Leptolyngbya sp.]